MSRLIIISNRLPYSVQREQDTVSLRQSSGGLVSAIKSYVEQESTERVFTEKIWVGVADFTRDEWKIMRSSNQETGDFSILPLFIDETTYNHYYNGFSNSVLWPLFHYFPSLAQYKTEYFEAYKKVNTHFAESLIPLLQPGDVIWVHDYQLMLLPQMLRAEIPDATIGFFLHIPFPSYELLRLLPSEWKKALVVGLLGADLVGFHTFDYVQHFIQSVKMLLRIDNNYNTLMYRHRLVKADVFPIGIDYEKFKQATEDHAILEARNEIKKNFYEKKIIFSVDRLDYTKGIMYRLEGFEAFLAAYPQWRENVIFIQNVVPSRDTIDTYYEMKRRIEEKVSTINGLYSTLSWQPVLYRYNHMDFEELSALYQAADVALITPLRDGMNLVAKEYVASCSAQRGVLILSELAGAASELNEAVLVNPTDVNEVAEAINSALTMPVSEQRYRMTLMQRRLMDYNVNKWVSDFMDQLSSVKKEQEKVRVKRLDDRALEKLQDRYRESTRRCILLDYDGTLSPFTTIPSEARPGADVKQLLLELCEDPRNQVAVISGRDADTLESWLGHLPLTLVAEHGAQVKMKGEEWSQASSANSFWKDEIRPLMQVYVSRCAGSFIEEKKSTLVWHYRNTAPELGFTRSRELINAISQFAQNTPVQVIDGNKVVEVRLTEVDKGVISSRIVETYKPDFILCMGDDTTDEDMFRALDKVAFTIKIGDGNSAAHYNILSQEEVLPLLQSLIHKQPGQAYVGA